MLFDSHSHINHEEFSEEERKNRIDEIVSDESLKYVMDIGCDLATSKLAAEHSEKYDWCFGAVGFHPHYADEMDELELNMIKSLASKKGIKAIGEIGLDFHYDYSPRDKQKDCFRKQIQMAMELKMPIVIHSREADQETMEILKDEGAFSEERKNVFPKRPVPENWKSAEQDARVLLHCFSGSQELGQQYVKLGATLSIAGPVTYKNNKKTIKVVEGIPKEFLLAETDSPFLTPEPFRGKPNKSSYIEHTVRRMAIIKGLDYEEMADYTCRNAERFYNI